MFWPRPKDADAARQADYALEIARKLVKAGYLSYLVGGVVRDSLMEISTLDVDICTACPTDVVREIVPDAKPWGPRRYSVFRVVTELGEIEIAHFRKELSWDGRHCTVQLVDSLEEDLSRRDFTVNAMAMEPETLEIIDIVGGLADLSARTIRTIGEPLKRFREDRLRMLRAVRFAAKLGFSIEKDTSSAISLEAAAVNSLSAERIRNELSSILTGPHPGRGMLILHELGLWEHLFPERADDPNARGWEHKLSVAERAAQAKLDDAAMWALALLPAGDPCEEDILSAADFLRRLKFSKKLAQRILTLCKDALYAVDFDSLSSERAVEMADSDELALLREIIFLRNPNSDFETALARRFPALEQNPFLIGNDLKEVIGEFSGAEVRKRLIKLREAELTGAVRSAEEARRFLSNNS